MAVLVDFNMDLAEGAGVEKAVIPFINRANISCGAHAGSVELIEEAVLLAKEHSVLIGAHPGYPDRLNFGRVAMDLDEQTLKATLIQQLDRLQSISKKHSYPISYIKPHGALYHKFCFDEDCAQLFVRLIQSRYPDLALMGLPNCKAETVCNENGVSFLSEGFADRAYNADGSLVARSKEGALLESNEEIWKQVESILFKQEVEYAPHAFMPLKVDSICFHGDHLGVVDHLKFIMKKLK